MKPHNRPACSFCGALAETVSEESKVSIGRRSARVKQEYVRCTSCGREYETPEQMEATERRAVAAIREREGLLQPEEVRRIRLRFSLTQPGFEKLLGVGKKTVVRWESGDVFQSQAADSLLRVLDSVPGAADFLAQKNGVQLSAAHADFSVLDARGRHVTIEVKHYSARGGYTWRPQALSVPPASNLARVLYQLSPRGSGFTEGPGQPTETEPSSWGLELAR